MTKRRREQLLKHLTWYKESVLGVSEHGTWGQGQYAHILPQNKMQQNLIDAGFYQALQGSLPDLQSRAGRVHKGFAHLNSSQALALNLFIPLAAASRLDIVLDLLDESDAALSGIPEHVEDKTEGTNFDYFISGAKRKFFFEVKYTEDRFASVNDDASHREKYHRVYEPRLAAIVDIPRDEFFRNYQLWRNIIYADRGTIGFMFPRFRTDLLKAVESARQITKFPERVKVLFVDDVVERAIDLGQPELRKHFQEFQRKYLAADSKKELT